VHLYGNFLDFEIRVDFEFVIIPIDKAFKDDVPNLDNNLRMINFNSISTLDTSLMDSLLVIKFVSVRFQTILCIFVDSKLLFNKFSERFDKVVWVYLNFSSFTGTFNCDLELGEINCNNGAIMDFLFNNFLVIIEVVIFKFKLVSFFFERMLILKLIFDS